MGIGVDECGVLMGVAQLKGVGLLEGVDGERV